MVRGEHWQFDYSRRELRGRRVLHVRGQQFSRSPEI